MCITALHNSNRFVILKIDSEYATILESLGRGVCMPAIVCELCGSNDIQKQDGLYVCQHCGTKYTVEEAKKLIGTVKIDTSTRADNLLQVARRSRSQGDYENANKYYSELLTYLPESWEANYYSVQCKVMKSIIAEITSAAYSLSNATVNSLQLIKNTVPDSKSQEQAVAEISMCTIETATMLFNAAVTNYDSIDDWGLRSKYREEYVGRINACCSCFEELGNYVYDNFPHNDIYTRIVGSAWTHIMTACKNCRNGVGFSYHSFYDSKSEQYEKRLDQLLQETKRKPSVSTEGEKEPSSTADADSVFESRRKHLNDEITTLKLKTTFWFILGFFQIILCVLFIYLEATKSIISQSNYTAYIGVTALFGLFGLIYAPHLNSERMKTEARLKSIVRDREKSYKK